MEVKVRNVNEAFGRMVRHFQGAQTYANPLAGFNRIFNNVPMAKRPYSNPNGSGYTLTIEEPVIITYERPWENVLFNAARDQNCFFTLYESLHMLAGRNDIKPLQYYNSQFNFSDDGVTQPAAYGYRWRHAKTLPYLSKFEMRGVAGEDQHAEFTRPEVDQLKVIIDHLKRKSESRRAVLSMWNVEDDLLKMDTSKDICCNLNIMFSIRHKGPEGQTYETNYLDMTVTNRSNDLILGMLGANAVHFSFLQIYMAAHLGVQVGVYNQISNNVHVYLNEKWQPEKWLECEEGEAKQRYYPKDTLVPLVQDPEQFDRELYEFVELHKDQGGKFGFCNRWNEPFLRTVAEPMLKAFHHHKIDPVTGIRDDDAALKWCEAIQASDWKRVAVQWLKKRIK